MAKQAREDAHDRDITLAWSIAALSRQKKLPDLKTLLTKRESSKQDAQNYKQLRTSLQLISETFRIPLKKKTTKKR